MTRRESDLKLVIHNEVMQNASAAIFSGICSADAISFLNRVYGISQNEDAIIAVFFCMKERNG